MTYVVNSDFAFWGGNIPNDAVRCVISSLKKTTPARKKEEMLEFLLEENPSAVDALYKEYKFAGRTAVDWFVLKGERSHWKTEDFWGSIIERYSTDIEHFGRCRPPLESTPQLIYAEKIKVIEENIIALMFAYNGPERRMLVDYEPRLSTPTYFDYVIIRPGKSVSIEVRGSYNQSARLISATLDIFDMQKSDLEHVELKGEEMCNHLSELVQAKLQTARHKSLIGDYDYIEVMADPIVGDLAKSERYNQELADTPSRRKILTFDFEYDFGFSETVTIEINTSNGNVWFRSSVGEQAISYVYKKILQSRFEEGADVSSDEGDRTVS